MKTFLQTAKLLLIGWGLAAAAVVLASFVSPERADMQLLRVVLLEVTLVTVPAHLVFRSPTGSLLTRRIVVTACAAVIAAAVPVLSGMRPFTWTFCAWTAGGIVATHYAYGLNFLRGLFARSMPDGVRPFDHQG